MRNIRTFKEWLKHGEPEHLVKSNIYVEDVSMNQKKTKMKELETLLQKFDVYYHYSDDRRSYQRGKEQQDEIEQLVKEIGRDGLVRYKKFFKQNESKETGTSYLDSGSLYSGFSFFPPTPKLLSTDEKSIKRNMIYGKVYNGE